MKIILTRGLPGSGKSTWAIPFAKENDYLRWNNDEFTRMAADGDFDRVSYGLLTQMRRQFILNATSEQSRLIIDNTNLNPRTLQEVHDCIAIEGYEVEVKDFKVGLDECLRRNRERVDGRVPDKVIYGMVEKYGHHYDWLS